MRDGIPSAQIADEMEELVRDLIPFVVPLLSYVHNRYLAHFVEQDVIGHMETELAESTSEQGRLRVAIAFADLAGYARLTVERGDEEALKAVERFVEAVERTLPHDARVIKTLGDEVMVVGTDPAALTGWAVGAGGLPASGEPLIVLLSGGRDSVCLLDVALALQAPQTVTALHLNYGLRDGAGADERHCALLCERLGVALRVVRADRQSAARSAAGRETGAGERTPPAGRQQGGNVQAWAREERYRAACELARELDSAGRLPLANGPHAADPGGP